MSEEKKEVKRDVQLMPGRMKEQEYARNLWVITVEAETTMEDIMKPSFWAIVALRMKPYDRVEVRCDDGAFFAELLVMKVTRTEAQMRVLSFLDLTAKGEDKEETTAPDINSELDDYEYKWRGPQKKHSIVRKSDNAVMVEEMESKEAALSWLTEYLNKAA